MNTQHSQVLQAILDNSEDLIVVSTPDRIRKYVNNAYCRFFQKDAAELINKSFVDDFPEDKKMFYYKFTEGMTPSHPTISATQPSGVKGGKQQLINWKETGIYDAQGNLTEIISIGRNIDEVVTIKKQKDELLTMLQAYEKAIDINMLCSITDEKGTIIHVNKEFCNISKYSRKELLGQNHRIINSGYHPQQFFKEMWNTIRSGNMWHGEIKNKAKDNTFYWVKTIILPMKNDEGHIDKYFSLRIPITEQKTLEDEKNNYVRSLENLLFMISHEMREPLTNCMGLLKLLEQGDINKDEYNAMFQHLLASARELDEYTRKTADFIQENTKNLHTNANNK